MNISSFLTDLQTTGDLSVAPVLEPFSEQERKNTSGQLREMYAADVLDMPLTAPPFHGEAASWGAETIYRIVQLILIRDAGEKAINEHLKDFGAPAGPEAIYSADLCLRYLPELWSLAKGLAPGDPLVRRLEELAEAWPFSSVGLEIKKTENIDTILSHPSLCRAYIDRIAEAKDLKRARHPLVTEKINEALGDYGKAVWPEFYTMQNIS
jgi:hypothetical protein